MEYTKYLDIIKINLLFNIFTINYKKQTNEYLIKNLDLLNNYELTKELIIILSKSENISFTDFYNFGIKLRVFNDINILRAINHTIEKNLTHILSCEYELLFKLFLEKKKLLDILYEFKNDEESEEVEESEEIIIKDETTVIDELCNSFMYYYLLYFFVIYYLCYYL